MPTINHLGCDVTQMSEDVLELVEAARAGGLALANRTYKAIVQARHLTVAETAMLSGKFFIAAKQLGVVIRRK